MHSRRTAFVTAAAVSSAILYPVLAEATIIYASWLAFTPPAWWPFGQFDKKLHYLSWWQLTHLLALVIASAPSATIIALITNRHWLVASLAVPSAFAVHPAYFLATAPDLMSFYQRASGTLDLVKFVVVLPAMTWGVRGLLALTRRSSGPPSAPAELCR